MGYWKLETWKEDTQGNDVELDEDDLKHISEMIMEGYTQGEVIDSDADCPHTDCQRHHDHCCDCNEGDLYQSPDKEGL